MNRKIIMNTLLWGALIYYIFFVIVLITQGRGIETIGGWACCCIWILNCIVKDY